MSESELAFILELASRVGRAVAKPTVFGDLVGFVLHFNLCITIRVKPGVCGKTPQLPNPDRG